MKITAVIDANVLWSAPIRDTLLWAARRGIYQPAWTDRILTEMERSLKARRPDLDPANIDRTIGRIKESFPEAIVEGYEYLVPDMQNHEGDRHVLAAAVRREANIIVTSNVNHFPAESCTPFEIEAQSPDKFLCLLWSQNQEEMAIALRLQVEALVNPPLTMLQLVQNLGRSVPQFANMVQESGLL